MKIFLKILTLTLSLGLAFWVFFLIGTGANQDVYRKIRFSIVNHPEFIPSSETVQIGAGGFQTLVGDFYWLGAIQYIGDNAVSADYKKYLGKMLGLITDLSPNFTYPTQIGLLLLPEVNERYENISPSDAKTRVQEAIGLGEKTIRATCDMKKVDQIKNEFDLEKLYADPALKNACTDGMIPYYLAYVENWSNNNPERASAWYKVAGNQDDAPKGARIMSAIMQGKSGDREKSIFMFLTLAEGLDPAPDGLCRQLSQELQGVLLGAFQKGIPLNKTFLQSVEIARKAAQDSLGEKQEEIEKTDISAFCSSYLNKAVREMNLRYIEMADVRYFKDYALHAPNAKFLFDYGYLDFLPRDYQKQSDEFEIIYVWDAERKRWDFEMGKY